MKLLKPGTGNQNLNRRAAIQFIIDNIIETDSVDLSTGNIVTKEGTAYHVSAYAETPAAFISTPGEKKSIHSIFESGLTSLMYRQLKKDEHSFIYEVNPIDIQLKENINSAQWPDIDKAATRIWVCKNDTFKLIDRS